MKHPDMENTVNPKNCHIETKTPCSIWYDVLHPICWWLMLSQFPITHVLRRCELEEPTHYPAFLGDQFINLCRKLTIFFGRWSFSYCEEQVDLLKPAWTSLDHFKPINLSYLQPSAFRRPSSLLPVCRLQKAFVSKMSLCKSRACIKAMLV